MKPISFSLDLTLDLLQTGFGYTIENRGRTGWSLSTWNSYKWTTEMFTTDPKLCLLFHLLSVVRHGVKPFVSFFIVGKFDASRVRFSFVVTHNTDETTDYHIPINLLYLFYIFLLILIVLHKSNKSSVCFATFTTLHLHEIDYLLDLTVYYKSFMQKHKRNGS